MQSSVLVVDDEPGIVEFVELNLKKEGFYVLKAYKGRDAITITREEKPDIIVLDIMLPDIDGFEVCRSIREFSNVPVIMLTAKGEDLDKIIGLEMGADDYMVKPFNPKVLTARIKAILRRLSSVSSSASSPSSTIIFKDMKMDLIGRTFLKSNKQLELTAREFDVLKFMAENPNRLLNRQEIIDEIWKHEYVDHRSVDVHIRRLREKIEDDPNNPEIILTVWGKGYKFNL
ncbi:MAG TPA: response regulator transcription factor [Candidatus Eremiobacteraeota bacterium]|nr:MAG: Transcriptional regulatory protein WalR [bacterium ADurb.Bin363]HPZ06665.1 response regulator transcription factor [Candidatus Eremiobacteraeota bacterium]